MFFGQSPTSDALHCILAHSLKLPEGKIRKGTVLTSKHIVQIERSGVKELTVARLEKGDIPENEAALLLAEELVGHGVLLGKATTGRVNCYAKHTGLLTLPRTRLLAINRVSETLTASTLTENRWVEAGKMVATIKIIPYAVDRATLDATIDTERKDRHMDKSVPASEYNLHNKLCVHEPGFRRAHLLQTTMQDTSDALLEKTERVTFRRLSLRNVQLLSSSQCAHDADTLSQHLIQLSQQINLDTQSADNDNATPDNWILIAGASAISDRRDVIPKAVEQAGGEVMRCGIPVDPGNLIMLGKLGSSTVIGIPGCARSPKHNGLDLFMNRLSCNIPMSDEWINSLAIGGLMDEIIDRPAPRSMEKLENVTTDKPYQAHEATAILLAGGSSKRFGQENKLLALFQGKPLIFNALDNIISSSINNVIVVLGHEAEELKLQCNNYLNNRSDMASIIVEYVVNPDFNSGMGSSLKAGMSYLLSHSLKESTISTHAALVCLADMPAVKPETINQLITAAHQTPSNTAYDSNETPPSAFVPTHDGKRGNPVLLMPELFDLILDISGDVGARHLLKNNPEAVQEVAVADPNIFADCDTPEQLAARELSANGLSAKEGAAEESETKT